MFRFCGFFLLCFIFLTTDLYGQLLGGGSSNKTSTPTKSASSSKTSAKKTSPTNGKSSKTDKPAISKSTAKSAKTNTSKNTKTVTKSVAKPVPTIAKNTPVKSSTNSNPPPQNSIVITPSKKTNGSFDELYEQAIDEGNSARDTRNYFAAETAYKKAQSLKPKDSRAIYGLGNIYSDQQRWESAERAYRQALLLEPNSAEANIALSFVLTQPISGAALADRYTEAEKLARKALEIDPNNAIGYDQLGVSLELRGVIDGETQDAYKRAIQIDPSFALAYAHLGRLQRRNGLANESASNYRQAVQFATDVPTMILVAEVMQSQQKYTDSEQLLRRAIREDEKNPSALFLLGRALLIRQSFDEAEKVLKTSLAVSPNSFIPYSILALVYQRRGNLDESEKTLNKALNIASVGEKKQLSQEFVRLGDEYLKMRKNKDAVRVFNQALNLDNGNLVLKNKIATAGK